jgi:hypothetical protein
MDTRYNIIAMALALIALAWFILYRTVHKIFYLHID